MATSTWGRSGPIYGTLHTYHDAGRSDAGDAVGGGSCYHSSREAGA